MNDFMNKPYGGYPNGYSSQNMQLENNMYHLGDGAYMNMNYVPQEALNSPYSPFIEIEQADAYRIKPGVHYPDGPLKDVINPDGSVNYGYVEQPSQQNTYYQVNQSTGQVYGQNQTSPQQQGGFNPYAELPPSPYYQTYPQNPAYGYPQPAPEPQGYFKAYPQNIPNFKISAGSGGMYNNAQPQMNTNPYLQFQQQSGYGNQANIYGFGGYGYNNGQYQRNMNLAYQEMIYENLYSFDIPGIDPIESLRGTLTPEERRLAELHTPAGYAYNGSPYYNKEQQIAYNEAMAKAKEIVIDFNAKLMRAAYNGSGTPINKEDARHLVDPDYLASQLPQPKSYQNMTEKELQWADRMQKVEYTWTLANKFAAAEAFEPIRKQKMAEGYAKIKESHDKIIGLTPETMDLKNYMANAGLLLVDAVTREQKRLMKDGRNKYDRNHYQSLLPRNNFDSRPLSMFTDDDYIPIERRIKDNYIRSKIKMMHNPDGTISPTPPPSVDPETEKSRQDFLNSALRGIKL